MLLFFVTQDAHHHKDEAVNMHCETIDPGHIPDIPTHAHTPCNRSHLHNANFTQITLVVMDYSC